MYQQVRDGCQTSYWGNSPPNGHLITLPDGPIGEVIPAPPCFTPRAVTLEPYNLIVSWDTEYVERERDGERWNEIISYQYSAVYQDQPGHYLYAEGILYTAGPDVIDRLSLGDILAAVLKVLGLGRRRANKLNCLLIAHFGVAEWAALRDRNKIALHVKVVRKVPITLDPFEVSVNLGTNNYVKLPVTMRDTNLLAPAKKQRLKDLADVTSHKKLDLSEVEISNMAQLLASDPNRYEAYAINDTRVTLEYYLCFMVENENLFGVESYPLP